MRCVTVVSKRACWRWRTRGRGQKWANRISNIGQWCDGWKKATWNREQAKGGHHRVKGIVLDNADDDDDVREAATAFCCCGLGCVDFWNSLFVNV